MASKEKEPSNEIVTRKKRVPRTPEEYERNNIALAMKLSSERLRDGTASAQEILYYLKLGSPETALNRQLLASQISLNKGKLSEIESVKRDAEMYEKAMDAMLRYRGDDNVIDGEYTDI